MASANKIVKYNLEPRVRELYKENKSLREIADTVSKESRHPISKDCIATFLKNDIEETTKLIESKTQLKTAVVEAEISTIAQRQRVINGLIRLAKSAENEHTRVLAFRAANDALDSLDKRLGQVAPDSQTVINITQNNLTLKEKIQRYRDMGILNGS